MRSLILGKGFGFTIQGITTALWMALSSLMAGTAAPAAELEIKVSYTAADVVYLDRGRDAGLAKGDLLTVYRGEKRIATLRVLVVARQSASCEVVDQIDTPAAGDRAVMTSKSEASSQAEENDSDSAPTARTRARSRSEVSGEDDASTRATDLSGTVRLHYYQFVDESGGNADFDQPGLRLNLRGRNLFGGGHSFRVRTRLRYEEEDDDSGDTGAWQNRIYEAALKYLDEDARFNYQLGRIISDKFSGVGYVDGGLLQANLGKSFNVGILAGTQPEWQHSDLRTSLKKYGLYGHVHHGEPATRLFESTLALVGEYHGGTVNREYVYLRNRFQKGSRWIFHQTAEVEINRDWREEKAGDRIALSNLHLLGRFRVSDAFTLGLSYDDRQNYYTFELRNRDERFFDKLSRQGYRLSFNARPTRKTFINGTYGRREREGGGEETTHYMMSVYQRGLFDGTWSANLRVNGFANPLTEGLGPSLGIGKRFRSKGHTLDLSYSVYDYDYLSLGAERHAEWLRLDGYFIMTRHFFLSSQLEYNTGDDAEGYRVYLSLGYRL